MLIWKQAGLINMVNQRSWELWSKSEESKNFQHYFLMVLSAPRYFFKKHFRNFSLIFITRRLCWLPGERPPNLVNLLFLYKMARRDKGLLELNVMIYTLFRHDVTVTHGKTGSAGRLGKDESQCSVSVPQFNAHRTRARSDAWEREWLSPFTSYSVPP